MQTLGLNKLNRSTAIPGLNREEAYALPILLPSILEQVEIVRRVEQLFTFADKLEQQTQNALIRINHLTPSILAKAFKGELTKHWRISNSDLISGENSVQALLEKIKADNLKVYPIKRFAKA